MKFVLTAILMVFCLRAQDPSPQPAQLPTVEQPCSPLGRPVRQPEWQADWYQVYYEMERIQKEISTDTILIHHSGIAPGITWQELSKLEYDRLYVPVYSGNGNDPAVKGCP